MSDYVILFAIVLAVNLLPAFGPPTWSIIVLYGFNSDLSVPGIVLVGALAAASGRYLLAQTFRYFGKYLPRRTRRNLAAAGKALEQRRRNTVLALGLFALSPLPSAQLFEAAGLAGVRLLGFTAAFFIGRTISYAIYAGTANSVRETSIGESFRSALTSLIGLSTQFVMIMMLVALIRIDWRGLLHKRKRD
ncbi:hypothetical protein [Sphingopyxis sp.]|uniref:hypothetical protein n=1 Tax=Sphingopyxis sp. TaxID=1908224 RepID=UPI001DE17E3F|nr:hypothetical protein [Sphingopyxis sp.]MBW8295698.1 hypothetical protein [Sphingopyxis sp.]